MAFTQADVDAIDRAIASGELLVRIDDKETRYQNADDLLKRRNQILSVLQNRSSARYQLANFSDDC